MLPVIAPLESSFIERIDLSKDIGMKVAAGEIVHLLNSKFGG